MGLAILGTILVTEMRNHVTNSLVALGLSQGPGERRGGDRLPVPAAGPGAAASIPHFFRLDFAQSTQTVLYVMAAIMAAAAIVAIVGLRSGVQQEVAAAGAAPRPAARPTWRAPMTGRPDRRAPAAGSRLLRWPSARPEPRASRRAGPRRSGI